MNNNNNNTECEIVMVDWSNCIWNYQFLNNSALELNQEQKEIFIIIIIFFSSGNNEPCIFLHSNRNTQVKRKKLWNENRVSEQERDKERNKKTDAELQFPIRHFSFFLFTLKNCNYTSCCLSLSLHTQHKMFIVIECLGPVILNLLVFLFIC